MEDRDEGSRLFVILRGLQSQDPGAFGQSAALWFYPSGLYTRLLDIRGGSDFPPSDDLVAYTHYRLSMSAELEMDGQGRVVLPDAMVKGAGIKKDITLLGAMDHLEAWNRDSWEQRRKWLIEQGPKLERWAQENLKPPSAETKLQPEPAQRDTQNQ
jgi:hypothetical protein